jgi:hypothetical protein
VTVTLDLNRAIALQKRLSRGAIFSGAMIYLEGIIVLVLLTQTRFSIPFLVPIAIVLATQFKLVRRPVRLLIREKLAISYLASLLLGVCVVALAALASRGGDERQIAAIMSALVVGATAWPVIAAIRAARSSRATLRGVADPAALLACLSFDVPSAISNRLRAFGGDRKRWAAPFVVGIAVGVGCLIALALAQQAMGFKVGGFIGQVAGLAGVWAFYRTIRHTKPRAAELRAKDTRPPVLVLRKFGDDELGTATLNPGRSFEHFFTRELDRIGPTISVGRPGERLAPLGASRDYLDSADWKSAVGTLIDDAAVIAFLLGDSESLLWEFRRTIETRGRARTLVIIPPLPDRREVHRRWTHFVQATASVVGPGLPAELPTERVLAFAFAGEDIVLFVGGREISRIRSWFSRGPMDYRLALRLFGCLLAAQPASARDVDAFMRAKFPLVA